MVEKLKEDLTNSLEKALSTKELKEDEVKKTVATVVEKFKDEIKPENIEEITDHLLQETKRITTKLGHDTGKVSSVVVEGFKEGLEIAGKGKELVKEFVKVCAHSAKKAGLEMMKLPLSFISSFIEGLKEK